MTDEDGWRRVASVAEVVEDQALPRKLDETPIALYRIEGEIYAIDDVCTHEYALLSQGFVEGCAIECPLHQAQFDIRTGRCILEPATVDLRTYPVRIEGGEVWVGVTPNERAADAENTH